MLGLGPFLLRGLDAATPQAQLGLLFEFLAVAMLALLPWGSGADRWRLAAGCAAAALLAAIVFPLSPRTGFGPADGLRQLGANFSLGAGFLDAGGAATVHLLGGLSALAVVWIAGPRRGKFPKEGLSTAMPGHNATYVLFGCLLALVGWLALELLPGRSSGCTLRLAALPGTAINTLLVGFRRAGRHVLRHAIPLRQARRQSLRQRLACRPCCLERLRGLCLAGGFAVHRRRSRHLHAAAGRSA